MTETTIGAHAPRASTPAGVGAHRRAVGQRQLGEAPWGSQAAASPASQEARGWSGGSGREVAHERRSAKVHGAATEPPEIGPRTRGGRDIEPLLPPADRPLLGLALHALAAPPRVGLRKGRGAGGQALGFGGGGWQCGDVRAPAGNGEGLSGCDATTLRPRAPAPAARRSSHALVDVVHRYPEQRPAAARQAEAPPAVPARTCTHARAARRGRARSPRTPNASPHHLGQVVAVSAGARGDVGGLGPFIDLSGGPFPPLDPQPVVRAAARSRRSPCSLRSPRRSCRPWARRSAL